MTIFVVFIIFTLTYGTFHGTKKEQKDCVILDRERMRYPIYEDNLIKMAKNGEITFMKDIENFYYFVVGYTKTVVSEEQKEGNFFVKMTENGEVVFIKDAEEKFYYFILGSIKENNEIFFLDKRSSEFVCKCNKIYIVNSDEMKRLSQKYPDTLRKTYTSGEIYAMEVPVGEEVIQKNVTNIGTIAISEF